MMGSPYFELHLPFRTKQSIKPQFKVQVLFKRCGNRVCLKDERYRNPNHFFDLVWVLILMQCLQNSQKMTFRKMKVGPERTSLLYEYHVLWYVRLLNGESLTSSWCFSSHDRDISLARADQIAHFPQVFWNRAFFKHFVTLCCSISNKAMKQINKKKIQF